MYQKKQQHGGMKRIIVWAHNWDILGLVPNPHVDDFRILVFINMGRPQAITRWSFFSGKLMVLFGVLQETNARISGEWHVTSCDHGNAEVPKCPNLGTCTLYWEHSSSPLFGGA